MGKLLYAAPEGQGTQPVLRAVVARITILVNPDK